MQYKKSPFFYLGVFLIGIFIFSYSLVLAKPGLFSESIEQIYITSNNVFADHDTLNKTQVILKSYTQLDDTKVFQSDCNFHPKLIKKQKYMYVYEFKFFYDEKSINCNPTVKIHDTQNDKDIFSIPLNNYSESFLMNVIIDYPTTHIEKHKQSISKAIERYLPYTNVFTQLDKKTIKKQRKYQELVFTKKIIDNILTNRGKKYLVPVIGYKINENHAKNKIPNTGRPYRQSYTDGIHHGWDVGTKKGEQTIALDDGVVVRVVDGFNWSDFSRIERGLNITDYQKTKNLDILRGNQVWLKTTKGDVVFYSHLDQIYTHIKPGVLIRRGEPIGTIGATGVPERNYKHFHLHFAIQKNPYNIKKVGKYSFDDYMNWDWYFKGKSLDYTAKNQVNVFEQ